MAEHEHHNDEPKIHGMIAEFDDPDVLIEATARAYKAGYRAMDAYTPFPIHGLAEAMGVRSTLVAPITLVGAIVGAIAGFALQYWVSAIAYPVSVGGMPYFSWPAFMPITFELTILFGGITAFVSMLALNGLPQPYHPIFNAKRFERASSDGFFLCIETSDTQYHPERTREFLEGLGPVEVSEVQD